MPAWTCTNCYADVDEGFDVCWRCGTSVDGSVNASFVREVDVATLPPGWVPRIKCKSCGYVGKVLIGHYGYPWWTLPLAVVLSCTMVGIVPWIIFFLVVGNRRFKACPNCDARDRLLDWDGADGDPPSESECIWEAKQEADRLAFQKNKLTMLAVVLIVLAVSLVLMLQWTGRLFTG